MKRLLLWSGIGIAIVIILLIIAWYQALAYLQGDTFRHTLEQQIENTSGAKDISLRKNLQIEGERISEEEIRVEGLQNIKEAQIGRLSIEMDRGELLDRRLHIKKLLIEEAALNFAKETSQPSTTAITEKKQAPVATKKTPQSSPKKDSTAKSSPSSNKESLFSIKEFLLDYAECHDLDVNYWNAGKEYSIAGTSAKATPISGSNNKDWQLTLENGRVHFPFSFLRDTSIRNAYITYNERSVNMSECRFMLTPGELRVKAQYNLKNNKWRSDLQANKADIDRLLNDDWKKRITGELFGKATMDGDSHGITRMDGVFSIKQGAIEGLPILSEISIGNSQPYRTIRLTKADCRVSYPYNDKRRNLTNAWLIDKIDVRAEKGTLRVHGHVIIAADESLGGTLTFGIPQSTLAALPLPANVTEGLFNAKGDAGFVWVNMNLSGTLENPEEDLSVRLTTILQSAIPEAAGKAASAIIQTLFHVPAAETEKKDDDANPGSSPKNNIIQQATDSAGDLLKGGLRAFF